MTNKIKNETTIELGDEVLTLRPTFSCLVAIETRTGKSLVQLVEEFAQQRGTLTDLLVVFEEGTSAAGNKKSKQQVTEFLEEHGVLNVQLALGMFFRLALYGGTLMPEDDEDTKKKNQNSRKKSTGMSSTAPQ